MIARLGFANIARQKGSNEKNKLLEKLEIVLAEITIVSSHNLVETLRMGYHLSDFIVDLSEVT